MYIYILIFLLVLIYAGRKSTKKNRSFNIILAIVCLFLSTGYMTGSDWRGYEPDYSDNEYFDSFEYLYASIIFLANKIGLSFWHYTIFSKILGFILFINLYGKLCRNKYGLVFWFSFFALFLWINHPARNFLAIILFSYAIYEAVNCNIIKYMFWCILATACHSSCAIFIPLYFYLTKRGTKRYVIDIAIIIVTFFISSIMRTYLDPLASIAFFSRINAYTLDEEYQGSMSMGIFVLIVAFLIMYLIKIDKIRKCSQHADFIYRCGLTYGFLFALANMSTILFRLPLYMMLPFSVFIGYLCSSSLDSFRIRYKYIVIAVSFYYMIHIITSHYSYVPYSSYMEYAFQEKPSYNKRFMYNYSNSPYNKK